MVKPIPSRRCDPSRQHATDYSSASDTESSQRDAETLHIQGEEYPQNSSVASNDDSIFSDLRHPIPGTERPMHLQPFQSYDGFLPYTLPTPAPRERITSLPEREEDELRPVPSQRRRSAPEGLLFSSINSSLGSGSRCEASNDLPPALKDIAVRGQELFWFILSEEVKAQEAITPGSFSALTISPSPQRMAVINERARFGGRTLRQIAEAFSHSSQRIRVREYAEGVQLQSLNYNSFSDLLFGLFQEGGVTQARVLVLFFFCADVALRALRENLTYHFQQLVDWTSRYITERLSAWVLDHGGWAAVLQESVDQAYKLAIIGVCILSIAAVSIFALRHH